MQQSGFVDALLPGDDLFPAASKVGVHEMLDARLREMAGDEAVDKLNTALRDFDADGIEREFPELFDKIRTVVFLTYYQMPAVQEAIRALGHRYNATPLPKGYVMGRFEAADIPSHNRGHYVSTADVRRVDLSQLENVGDDHG